MKTRALIASLALAALAAPASADVIYETDGPFGGFFGLWGPDVGWYQSVGLRFTPDKDYTLDQVSVWFMNNDDGGDDVVTLSIQTDKNDGKTSVPSGEILDTADFIPMAVGWDPVLEVVQYSKHPLLKAGENYWIVAESDADLGENPVWLFSAFGTGFTAFSEFGGNAWQPGGEGAVLTVIVEGTAAGETCYPDFNGDGALNLFDFLAYTNAFNAGDENADCDASGALNLFDFLCFTNAFNAGC